MDRSAVQEWLDRYVEAWRSYDPDQIASLFAENATYRYHPYDPEDEVTRGRDAIVRDWVEPEGNASTRDAPGTYEPLRPYVVEGDRAVAVGTSRLDGCEPIEARPDLLQRVPAPVRRRRPLRRLHGVLPEAGPGRRGLSGSVAA